MNFTKIIVSFIFLLLAQNTFAENIKDRTVKKIMTYKTYVLVEFSPNSRNDDGCTHPKSTSQARIELNNEGAKVMVAQLNMLYMTKSDKLTLGVSGCKSGSSAGTMPKIYRVDAG